MSDMAMLGQLACHSGCECNGDVIPVIPLLAEMIRPPTLLTVRITTDGQSFYPLE